MKHRRDKGGFSTIELLLAFAVALIIIPPVIVLAVGGERTALDVSLQSAGISRAATQVRDALFDIRTNWDVLPVEHTYSPYTQTNARSAITPCVQMITASTSWRGDNAREKSVSLDSLASSIEEFSRHGNCDPFPASSWDGATVVDISDPIGDATTTDLAVVNDGGRSFAIITTVSPNLEVPDLHIFDITDRTRKPLLIASLNIGVGVNALVVINQYAYVAVNEPTNQLQVVRLFDTTKSPTDPLYVSPVATTMVTLPGVAGALPEGRSIAYYDNTLHVGTWNNNFPATSHEYFAFNVTSRENPILIGSLNVGHSVNDIDVSDGYAFLATTDNSGELTIIDARTSALSIHALGNVPGTTDAESIRVLGNSVTLGFERPGGSSQHVATLDITDMMNITVSDTLRLTGISARTTRGIAVSGDRLFLGLEVSGMRVLDSANPTDVVEHGCGASLGNIEALEHSRGAIIAGVRSPARVAVISDGGQSACSP